MSTRPLRFFHRGQTVQLEGMPITRSVLEWLREDAHCTGTKEGCAEGDCGACTVLVAELAGATDAPSGPGEWTVDGLRLRSVNSCLLLLPMLDGKALVTVEDLPREGELHPVQQALVDCHGSQCGFCTPGFVMSLACTYERHQACGSRPTRAELADDLAGNLCRCTGYRPILDAAEQMFERPVRRLDTASLRAGLQALQADPPLHHAAPNPAAGGRIDHFHAPRTLDELATLREALPTARLLAGATDIGLWVTKQFRNLGDVIYLGQVAELQRIDHTPQGLRIGAGASLEAAWAALAERWPTLQEIWRRFAGPPVRHAGTMGGNVANGSPIGDSAPVLMALGARVELRRGARVRQLALEDFYLDYMKNALEPGEFLSALFVPASEPGTQVQAYKLSKRFDCDISTVCAGLRVTLNGSTVTAVRLAFGGMAGTVRRAGAAEAALMGGPFDEAALARAVQALAQDFTPLSDQRASADYRLQAAGGLLRRFWMATRPEARLPLQALSVFAA